MNQPNFSLLELTLFETCNSPTPYYSSCIVEGRFLLLGHCTNGIQVLDLKGQQQQQQQQQQPKTIIWIQARQMKTLSSCGLLLVLPDRSKKIRCYSLAAIIRLCYGALGLYWTQDAELAFPLEKISTWNSKEGRLFPTSSRESRFTVINSATTAAMDQQPPLLILNGGLTKRYLWHQNRVVLQDYCYKLPNSKDSLSMHVYSTTGYIFVALVQRDRIILWQRQRKQSTVAFHHLKDFWIPGEAHSISFADDRTTLRHIIAVFSHGASLIGIQNSKVTTVPIDSQLKNSYQAACLRQQYETYRRIPNNINNNTDTHFQQQQHQPALVVAGASLSNNIPSVTASTTISRFTRSNSNPTSLSSPPSPSHTSRQPLNFHGTSLQWTSLIQLPFYPDRMASLTVEFSIPPSYTTVMTRTPFEATDPVALPSTTAPQLFLATFGCQSMIIDMNGVLFSTQVYTWSEPPELHIAFLPLQSGDWYAVGFAKESVHVMHMASAKSHRVMNGVPIRFLGQSRHDGGTLMWTCVNGKTNQVYSLSSSSDLRSSAPSPS
ncbi:unnamed protein product [Absidia cylindrospora]